MIDFYGTQVFIDPQLVDMVQVCFPKTRKKRIRKKWAKRPENFRAYPRGGFVKIGGSLYAHPVEFKKLCEARDLKLNAGADGVLRLTDPGLRDRSMRNVEERLFETLVGNGFVSRGTSSSEVSIETILDSMRKVRLSNYDSSIRMMRKAAHEIPMEGPVLEFVKYNIPRIVVTTAF